MFITYDYRCIKCKKQEARFVKKEEKDEQKCSKCGSAMLRLPPTPAFKV